MITIINRVAGWIRWLAFSLSLVGGAILVFSLLSVLADIATRTLFGMTMGAVNLTFRGSYELVRFGLLLSMLYALPYALKNGQVVVEIFTERLSDRSIRWLTGFYIIFFGLFGVVLSLGLLDSIERANRSGTTSQDFGIPMAYIYWLAFVGTVTLALRGFSVAWEYFTDYRDEDA